MVIGFLAFLIPNGQQLKAKGQSGCEDNFFEKSDRLRFSVTGEGQQWLFFDDFF